MYIYFRKSTYFTKSTYLTKSTYSPESTYSPMSTYSPKATYSLMSTNSPKLTYFLVHQVSHVWTELGLLIVSDRTILNRIQSLLSELEKILKNSGRSTGVSPQKRVDFIARMDTIFDISAGEARAIFQVKTSSVQQYRALHCTALHCTAVK